jgi:LysR family transcriptional regulator, carnitine catabolism transcriptional activator
MAETHLCYKDQYFIGLCIMRINLTPQQLAGFLQVAATGSFSEAAHLLAMSQPALSRMIRIVEDIIGARLFDRDTRHVALTPAGSTLRPIAQRIVSEFNHSFSDLAQFVAGKRGHVMIAALPSVAAVLLPRAIARFSVSTPGVQFLIKDGLSDSVFAAVSEGRADIGLTVGPSVGNGLDYMPLVSDEFCLVCRADDALAESDEPLSWSIFAERRFVAMAPTSSVRAMTDAAFLQLGIAVAPLYECAFLGTTGHLVAAGLGITALPRLTLPLMGAVGLITRPLIEPQVRRHIGVITRAERTLAPAVRFFLETFVAEAKDR